MISINSIRIKLFLKTLCFIFILKLLILQHERAHSNKTTSIQQERKLFIQDIETKCGTENYYRNHTIEEFAKWDQTRANCTRVSVLIFVNTKYNHFHERDLIRSTWGRQISEVFIIRTIFFVGLLRSNESFLENRLQEEYSKYGDIIQIKILDTYRNIVYKHLYALKWLTDHCSHVPHVVKVDDDVFINTVRLKNLLQQGTQFLKQDPYIYGSKRIMEKVPRNILSKWYTTYKEFPYEYFPIHVKGYAYITSGRNVKSLLYCSYHHELYWVDDVFVTGILADQLRIERINFFPFYGNIVFKPGQNLISDVENTLFVLANWKYTRREAVWTEMWRFVNKIKHQKFRLNREQNSIEHNGDKRRNSNDGLNFNS